MGSFISLLKTPKTQIGFLLTLIFITAFFNNPSLKVALVFVLSVGSTLLFDLLFLKARGIKPFFPSASLVTGSIIGLLTSPLAIWYIPVTIAAFAVFSKNFIRFDNRHVFNPAAFGLLVSTLIFANPVSWWAVSFQQFSIFNFQFSIPFIILLSPALVSIVRMKRYRITLSFLFVYILMNTTFNSKFLASPAGGLILNSITDPTTLFFTTVMLPEPMTTPNNHKRQIIFGAFVALLAITISLWNSTALDAFILALLIGNAVFFKFR